MLFLVVVAALVFVVVPYFVLPAVFEGMVASEVQDGLDLAREPDVELDSDPQWEMLLGEFSGGEVSVGGTDLGAVRAENVAMDLDPMSVDVTKSIRGGTLVLNEPVSGQVRGEISEDEVARLAQENAQVPVNDVRIARSGVTVDSEATALGSTFPVAVRGGIGVDSDALVFRPESVRTGGVTVPGYLADSLLAGTSLRFPVEGLPYGGTLTGARPKDGAVVLTGRVSGVELGAAPGG